MTREQRARLAQAIIEVLRQHTLEDDTTSELVRDFLDGYVSDADLLFVLGWLAGLVDAATAKED